MIIDISQELRGCKVFPGDEPPKFERVRKMEDGELYNLSNLSICVHNGTHVDAPKHFIKDGKSIDEMPLDVYVGDCYVARYEGVIDASIMHNIMAKSNNAKRILVAGNNELSLEAAKVLNEYGVILYGNESQTVGPENAPMAVHIELLGKGVTLLEGIVLKNVEEGKYFLSCAPINIKESDGSICRAYLIKE